MRTREMLSEDRRPFVHETVPKPARTHHQLRPAQIGVKRVQVVGHEVGKVCWFRTSTTRAPVSVEELSTPPS